MNRLIFSLLATSAVIVVTAGCGPSKGPSGTVTGTIKYKGKSLPQGSVTFHASDGKTGVGPINDGSYTVEEAPLGDCKVTIVTPPPPMASGVKDPAKGTQGEVVAVPPEYANPEKTPLKFKVEQKKQTFDIDAK